MGLSGTRSMPGRIWVARGILASTTGGCGPSHAAPANDDYGARQCPAMSLDQQGPYRNARRAQTDWHSMGCGPIDETRQGQPNKDDGPHRSGAIVYWDSRPRLGTRPSGSDQGCISSQVPWSSSRPS